MTATETTRTADGHEVLVVFEGPDRLIWSVSEPGRWRLVGIWPTASDRGWVADHLDRGGRTLVVLASGADPVPLLPEELAMPADQFARVAEDDFLLEVTLPLLDWLPEPAHSRGRQFAAATAAGVRPAAAVLHPPLIVEPVPVDEQHPADAVRFARRTRLVRSRAEVLAVAGQAFDSGRAGATPAPMPAGTAGGAA